VLRRIIVVLMREKRAVRVWWPVDTKWCADAVMSAREGRPSGVITYNEGLGVCVEEPPFDGGDYPRDFAELLRSLPPMVGSDEVAVTWLKFLATLPGYNYAKVLNFQASNYLAGVGGGNAVVVEEEKLGGEEGGPERGPAGS
jgi:hypothetical protein